MEILIFALALALLFLVLRLVYRRRWDKGLTCTLAL